ncbi:phage tail protein [Escherichia coli]|uniref:phage tail protein n=1 Tax=Escherichia coli TaxID=562 RepID=UPI001932C08D|nr:phage tail protein [Escherichia coli]MBL7390981.1 phage tail protein [Escherichia coli]UWH33056.1 phage tail protein [Escherichia coli]UWH37720.1 phage tail protein [Escherichia coli]
MADDSLKTPVIVRAISLNASSLPDGYSPAYSQYILSQAIDFTNVAGKANEAGQGAYDAQVKNDEQDTTLANHETRISALRVEVDGHEIRITANTNSIAALDVRVTSAEGAITTIQGNITSLQTDVTNLTTRVSTAENNITTLQGDYVSKSVLTSQSLASPLSVTTSYSVGGTKVVGARNTGWTASTGTASKAGINGSTTYAVSATYTQSEVQAIATGLQQVRQLAVALQTALGATSGHGLINA